MELWCWQIKHRGPVAVHFKKPAISKKSWRCVVAKLIRELSLKITSLLSF